MNEILQLKINNQEFKITSSETSLRYLAGEPDSESKKRSIKIQLKGIEEAKRELARLKSLKSN